MGGTGSGFVVTLGHGRPIAKLDMTGDAALRVLVVDDHELYRSGLGALLEDEGFDVAAVASGEEAVSALRSFRADVVVMDVNMPGMSGIEATRRVLGEHPGVSVMMLTINRDDDRVLEAVRAGASGYLLKDADLDDIVEGIRPLRQPVPSPRKTPPSGVLTGLVTTGHSRRRNIRPESGVLSVTANQGADGRS
jgi:CheY-like chemotaxis protein